RDARQNRDGYAAVQKSECDAQVPKRTPDGSERTAREVFDGKGFLGRQQAANGGNGRHRSLPPSAALCRPIAALYSPPCFPSPFSAPPRRDQLSSATSPPWLSCAKARRCCSSAARAPSARCCATG